MTNLNDCTSSWLKRTIYNTGSDLLNHDEAAVAGAFHNSLERSDPSKCHKHTWEAILDKIMD